MYRFKWINGHVVVFKDGLFWGSYDTIAEAHREIEKEELYEEGEL